MTDIVERLRRTPADWQNPEQKLLNDAANAIEFMHGMNKRADEQIAELRSENEALRTALRTVAVVGYQMGVGTWCRVCHEWWLTAAPEAHKPDCLAAPKEGA